MLVRIAGQRFGTRANRRMMHDHALRVDTARARARVGAFTTQASQIERAIGVAQALRMAGRIVDGRRSAARIAHRYLSFVDLARRVRFARIRLAR